jgi:hypothetical protein
LLQIGPPSVPSRSCPIHHLSVYLPFDAVWWQIPTATINRS